MITEKQFESYRVGDLLIWVKTNSLCLVIEKSTEELWVHVVEGGKYPSWVGETRGYSRSVLSEGRDFRHVWEDENEHASSACVSSSCCSPDSSAG